MTNNRGEDGVTGVVPVVHGADGGAKTYGVDPLVSAVCAGETGEGIRMETKTGWEDERVEGEQYVDKLREAREDSRKIRFGRLHRGRGRG